MTSLTVANRLARMIDGLPDGAAVTLPVVKVREWVDGRLGAEQPTPAVGRAGDRLLTAQEVADVLSVDKTWVYRHADTLLFTRRISENSLRFSESGLQKWMASRKR
jgi:predicted DNA-binding transcriptional regulator AlpA